jgi:hypothetical protein
MSFRRVRPGSANAIELAGDPEPGRSPVKRAHASFRAVAYLGMRMIRRQRPERAVRELAERPGASSNNAVSVRRVLRRQSTDYMVSWATRPYCQLSVEDLVCQLAANGKGSRCTAVSPFRSTRSLATGNVLIPMPQSTRRQRAFCIWPQRVGRDRVPDSGPASQARNAGAATCIQPTHRAFVSSSRTGLW